MVDGSRARDGDRDGRRRRLEQRAGLETGNTMPHAVLRLETLRVATGRDLRLLIVILKRKF